MHVFCAGMYRSCSTWQYEIASHLVENHLQGRRLGFMVHEQFRAQASQAPADSTWQVLKTHDGHEGFANALNNGQARALYSYRDLRDVTYSLLHKYQASFDVIVEQWRLLHVCLANDEFWSSQPGVLCQRYSDLVADPVNAIEQIADHLDISLEDAEAKELAEAYSWEANRRRTAEYTQALKEQNIDLNDAKNTLLCDQHTLLHWNHLRSRDCGSWRDLATPIERTRLAQICGPWLIARGYERDDRWAIPPEVLHDEIADLSKKVSVLCTQLKAARSLANQLMLQLEQTRSQAYFEPWEMLST